MESISQKFSQIYDSYIAKVYRFVLLKVDSSETAEDLCSEVFTRFWHSLNSKQDIKNPQAFIFQIARNMVADHYREKNKIKTVSVDDCPELEDRENLEEQVFSKSDFEQIKLALSKIKPEYQDVVFCHYIEDMPIREIAEVMDKTEGNIRIMLHRGLKALKKELA